MPGHTRTSQTKAVDGAGSTDGTTSSGVTRRELIRAGGACLAGAAALGGLARCSQGSTGRQDLHFTMGPDITNSLRPFPAVSNKVLRLHEHWQPIQP